MAPRTAAAAAADKEKEAKKRVFVKIPEPLAMDFVRRPTPNALPVKKEEKGVHKRLALKLFHLKKKSRLESVQDRHSKMVCKKNQMQQQHH